MKLYLNGVGIIAPGLPDWSEAGPVLRGERDYQDAPLAKLQAVHLPAAERRRATAVTKLALDVAQQACGDRAAEVATVFASSGGEVEVIDRIFQELATPAPQISPTLFHNSVHNAASGYWSIATGSRHSAMSLSAFDDTFAAGLLESAVQAATEAIPVLLVCYDFPPLPPIARHRPLSGPFGVALLLQPERDATTVACLDLQWPCRDAATAMSDSALEALRLGNPAGRGLPLLTAVACREPASVVLEFSGHRGLRIDVAMNRDRSRFDALIPHRGGMSLIDRVLQWDGQIIVCASSGHLDPAHPLRGAEGRLGCCIGLEYGAQAAALHGGLLAEQAGIDPPAGYLAGARALRLHRRWLDDLEHELIVRAERLLGSEQSLLYGFSVSCGGEPVCEGRLSVFFNLLR